jgi:hypothetical protein
LGVQFSQHHLLKRLSFSPLNGLGVPLPKIIGQIYEDLFWCLFVFTSIYLKIFPRCRELTQWSSMVFSERGIFRSFWSDQGLDSGFTFPKQAHYCLSHTSLKWIQILLFFFLRLGLELRTSCLQSRCSTAWITPPVPNKGKRYLKKAVKRPKVWGLQFPWVWLPEEYCAMQM